MRHSRIVLVDRPVGNGEPEDALPVVVDAALDGSLSALCHPLPDRLSQSNGASAVYDSPPDALKRPISIEGEMPHYKVDRLGEDGVALLEAEHSVDE